MHFPHFFDGAGGDTTVTLLNTTGATQHGTLAIFNDDGSPLEVTTTDGQTKSSFNYSIPPGGAFVLQTDGSLPNARLGRRHSRRRIRLFIDRTGGHDTGVAVANPNGGALTIQVKVFDLDGATERGQGALNVAAGGHQGKFSGELVAGLPDSFKVIMELSADQTFVAVTLRTLVNGRGDFLITTFPVADLERTAPARIIFPQVAGGAGILTELIFIAAKATAGVTVNYFGDGGRPISLATQ